MFIFHFLHRVRYFLLYIRTVYRKENIKLSPELVSSISYRIHFQINYRQIVSYTCIKVYWKIFHTITTLPVQVYTKIFFSFFFGLGYFMKIPVISLLSGYAHRKKFQGSYLELYFI